MAKKKRKNEAVMGRALIILGLILKILQIIGASFSLEALTGTNLTFITTCLLVGGLAVLSVERMSTVSAFALISLVGIVGGVLPTNDANYSFIFMMVNFAAYALMLFFMKKRSRAVFGAAIIVLSVLLVLHTYGAVVIPVPLITVILIAVYVSMALGLLL